MQTASHVVLQQSIPQWVEEYISVPFEEGGRTKEAWDCWGLVVVAMQEHFGIELPLYSETVYNEASKKETSVAVAELVDNCKKADEWFDIDAPEAKLGDVIIINILSRPIHIGLVVAQNTMLHAMKGIGTSIEDYEGIIWHKRAKEFYRHELLCSN